VKDPLEGTEVRLARPWLWVLAFVALAIFYVQVFPEQMAYVAMLLSLPAIIFLHELGHFLTAKRTGMKVTEFFVGFGPRVWSFRRGETEYGVKAVPLGGYCRIVGMTNLEEVRPEDEPRAYRSKGYGARVLVAVAGSAMHGLIALVLVFGLLTFHGDWQNRTTTLTLDEVTQGLPAYEAGLRPGDRVVAVDGQRLDDYGQLYDYLGARNDGETVTFTYERGGATYDQPVTLRQTTIDGITRVRAGIAPRGNVPKISLGEAAVKTPQVVYDIGKESVGALGKMFSLSGIRNYFGLLSGDENADETQRFLSPVGYARVGGQAVQTGFVESIMLLILINVFVGLFNLVPLLPFDGGHIALATYEKVASIVKRRPVHADAAKLLPLTAIVVGILGFIFLSSVFLDIARPADNPF